MEEQNKRKSIFYLTIGVLTLIALIVGATYAYFQAQTGNNAVANLNTTTGTTDNLTFSTDGNILINASADNFGENMGDQVSQASAMATLIPNNTDNHAEETYNVYLVINENTFEYTTGEENPELILSVRKDEEEYIEVKELDLKEDITINKKDEGQETIKGYDITEKRGLIKIADGITITADKKQEIDNWEIRIILKNLETDQNKNTGKTFNGKIIIQKEDIPTKILDVCQSGDNLAKCLIKLHDESEYGITKLVYHDEQEDYKGETNYTLEADDFSYRYSGPSEEVNNYVCFGGDCSNNPENENYSNLYRIIGVFPTTETKDSDEKTYQIKIIKADYATAAETGGEGVGAYREKYNYGSYYYKGNKSITYPKIIAYYLNNSAQNNNNWKESALNTENLNKIFINYIKAKDLETEKWFNILEEHNWVTSGNTWNNLALNINAKNAYISELKNPQIGNELEKIDSIVNAKVGLMYVSDYMYGASNEYWKYVGNSSGIMIAYNRAINSNWLHNGLNEWTITRDSNSNKSQMLINEDGSLGTSVVQICTIRPTMYFNTDVKIYSGSGTSDDPYILSL